MLKPKYEREDQIPENVKGAYVADSSGVWVLDDLDAEHPIVKKNKELQREKTTLASENTKLANANTLLETKAIPEGFIAVKAELAPFVEKIQSLEIPLEELPTLKEENDRYKRQETERTATAVREGAAEKLGYSKQVFARLAKDMNIVKDGDEYFESVKDGDKTENKPLTKEYVESSENFKPFLSSLTNNPPRSAHSHDPAPAALVDDKEADKQAQNSQARATHSFF